MTEASAASFPPLSYRGFDGAELAYRELGEGRTLVLLHGFFADSWTHWIAPGHADKLATAGFRVVLPDLRGHGASVVAHGPGGNAPDVLSDDGLALLRHLGVEEFDLGGYSLGARTTLRILVRGAVPGRAVIAGMGFDGVNRPGSRNAFYRNVLTNLGTFDEHSLEWRAERFLRKIGGDPQALLRVLETSVPTTTAEIRQVDVPTLCVVGAADYAHRSAERLAGELPQGRFTTVPGSHTGAIRRPEFADAIARFLAARP